MNKAIEELTQILNERIPDCKRAFDLLAVITEYIRKKDA